MPHLFGNFNAMPVPTACRRGIVRHRAAAFLTMLALGLSGPVHAAPSPEPAPSAEQSSPTPIILSNPAETLTAMADYLDKDPDLVVLTLETLTITQGDLAGVIRAMPPSLANLGFQDIYQRAMDVMTRQKAMVLRARRDGLDTDAAVIRRGKTAFERILSDAWLTRQADAAVTEQALHARFDRDVAGRPAPDEVRARAILVPTETEASDIIRQLAAGADFANLAHQYSKDPSAAGGGDLGYLTRDSLSPEVGSAIFSLATGQVTAYPVRAFAGYFILRAEGRQSRAAPTFEQARANLERDIRADAVVAAVRSVLSNIKFIPADKPDILAQKSKR